MASALCNKSAVSTSRAVRPQASRRSVAVNAAARPLWLPGFPAPSYLPGTAAGDYGFDPLGLAKEPEALKWYTQAELIHSRVAMTAVAAIWIPAELTRQGIASVPEWFVAGAESIKTPGSIPFGPQVAIMHILVGFVETKRWMDMRKPGSQAEPGSFLGFESSLGGTAEVGYPGGPFDVLQLSKNPETFTAMKKREIANGRLAMLAMLGFFAQYGATGKGPMDNLVTHLKDPLHTTFADNGVSVPFF